MGPSPTPPFVLWMACLDDWPRSGILSLCQQKCQVHLPFNYMQCLDFNIPKFSLRKRLLILQFGGGKNMSDIIIMFFSLNLSRYPHLLFYKHFALGFTFRFFIAYSAVHTVCGYMIQHYLFYLSYFPLIFSWTHFTLNRPLPLMSHT